VPRFISTGTVAVHARPPARDAAEASAEKAAQGWIAGHPGERVAAGQPAFSSRSREQARTLARASDSGRPLFGPAQHEAQVRYGIDASNVRVHDDAHAARVAGWLGANAVTTGRDIFFAAGRYAPETPSGQRLLAHELAHVAQQGGEPLGLQCDIQQTLPVTLGEFQVSLVTQVAGPTNNAGLMGTVAFDPDPNGPYSAEIGLVQAVNVTDVRGTTNRNPGGPLDWSNDVPGGANPEAGRMELMTDGSGSAAPGWFIDSSTANNPRGSGANPNYIEQFNSPPPVNQYGWLRSPDDHGPTSLWDFPNSPHDVNFDFETVAKGTDNQTVYGSLFWGFQIRSNAVAAGSEYARAQDGASAIFEEALERFRGYFVHEPVVLYFDTNSDTPIAGEETKLADLRDYFDRYPDVTCALFGYADVRGGEAYNADLAQRRADSVENLLLLEGIGLDRITGSFGIGETEEFSQHGTALGSPQPRSAGRLRANRRVEISFEHNVSGYPIVMP